MRIHDLETPSAELVTRAPFHVAPRGSSCFFTTSTWADDNIVASVSAIPVVRSLTPPRGAGLGQNTVYSEHALLPCDGVAATTLHKAAWGTFPSASLVGTDPAWRTTKLGPQTPSVLSHSVSRVAGATCTVVPAAPPRLLSPSRTAPPSPLPSDLISTRTHRRRAAFAGTPQAVVDYESNLFDRT